MALGKPLLWTVVDVGQDVKLGCGVVSKLCPGKVIVPLVGSSGDVEVGEKRAERCSHGGYRRGVRIPGFQDRSAVCAVGL